MAAKQHKARVVMAVLWTSIIKYNALGPQWSQGGFYCRTMNPNDTANSTA